MARRRAVIRILPGFQVVEPFHQALGRLLPAVRVLQEGLERLALLRLVGAVWVAKQPLHYLDRLQLRGVQLARRQFQVRPVLLALPRYRQIFLEPQVQQLDEIEVNWIWRCFGLEEPPLRRLVEWPPVGRDFRARGLVRWRA